jgi:hypothetical protein
MPMSDLLRVLAGDCPELNSTNSSDRSDVRCPTLAELPAQQGQWLRALPLAGRGARAHAREMFVLTEADAAAIRAAFDQGGELSAVVELRRRFPGIADTMQARACVRSIAGWKPLSAPGNADASWQRSLPLTHPAARGGFDNV